MKNIKWYDKLFFILALLAVGALEIAIHLDWKQGAKNEFALYVFTPTILLIWMVWFILFIREDKND